MARMGFLSIVDGRYVISARQQQAVDGGLDSVQGLLIPYGRKKHRCATCLNDSIHILLSHSVLEAGVTLVGSRRSVAKSARNTNQGLGNFVSPLELCCSPEVTMLR